MAHETSVHLLQTALTHHEAVYRYAYRLTGKTSDAEDLTQHCYLELAKNPEQLHKVDNLLRWLFAIVRNTFLKSFRKKSPTSATSLEVALDEIPDLSDVEEPFDREKLQNALNLLPGDYKVLIMMFYFEEMSYREMAEKLVLPVGTVMSRLSRAKGCLRGALLPEVETSLVKTTDHKNLPRLSAIAPIPSNQ